VKFNISPVIGFVGGFLLLALAIGMTSSEPIIFVSLPSVIIVFGGTLMATLITFSWTELRMSWKRLWRVLRREPEFGKAELDQLVEVADLMHKGKPKQIEELIPKMPSPYLRATLRMLADGNTEDDISAVLQARMRQMEEIERNEAAVFRTMATYSPAFGMAGTLIGLVNMLRMMGDGGTPAMIGVNMATALLTTFYGVVLANAVLKPIAARIEKKCHDRMRLMATILEAARAMAQGRATSHVRELLYALAISHTEELGKRDTLQPMTERDLYGDS
jgi:chemotaxis protein MotA